MIKVSVVCPTYNSSKFIGKTVESILSQSLLPNELILVDDGSIDNTVKVLKNIASAYNGAVQIKIIGNKHLGPGATRNTGINACENEWVAFMDSDDIWEKNKLENISIAIKNNPKANFFCHNEKIKNLDNTENVINYANGYSFDKSVSDQLYKRNYFSTSAVVCKRDLLVKWKGFDESLSSAQDYELWLRMSDDLIPVFVPDILGYYIMRKGNISTSKFWKRLLNMIRIKLKHRTKVSLFVSCNTLFITILYHLLAPVVARIKQIVK